MLQLFLHQLGTSLLAFPTTSVFFVMILHKTAIIISNRMLLLNNIEDFHKTFKRVVGSARTNLCIFILSTGHCVSSQVK